ncbi:MAG: TraB/GumN family protein [Chitinophagaceae bacterium]|nr:TraB/GumN family protein [Chitinophagaceae bacterium]
MPTIMDTWLQSIAHRHNKWLGAIEDVGDQLPLLDQFGTSIQKTPEGKSFDPTPLLLEMMVNYYLKKDLNAIEKWLVSREDRFDMIKRNKKMAYRIDSLAQIRSIFFTVGAAHLPGDSGVIKLLRNRGFHVEPVWSSKTIDPDDYLKNLPELKWITFREANGDYEIDLPGTPSPLVSNGVETQFYMDLSTMTFYMAGGLVAPNNASLDSVTKSMMKNMNADLISSKPITYQSLSGLENVFDSNDGHFVVRLLKDGNTVYLLMVGSEKEEVITSPDAGRYFSSFKPLKKPSKTNLKDEWVLLSLPEKGVKLEFPIKPKRNKAAESKTEGTNWSFQIYDLFDMKQEGYFLLNIRETMPGYHLTEDSVFFKEIETSIKDNLTKVTEKQLRTYQGYPSYYLKGINEDQGTTFGLFMVIRGNRIYQLVAGGATSNKNVDGLIERFFTQLNLIEYDATPYSRKNSPSNSFQVYGPKDFHVVADSNATTSKTVHYTTFDDQRQVTYEIYAEAISPYLWTATDSAFLEEKGKVYIAYNDSIESKKAMWNGKAPSLHWVVKEPGNNLKKLVRVVASKDSLYTLITVIQTQEINASDIFFNKFLTTTAPGKNLTASKTSLLLKDLQSKDTATFEEAKEALSVVKFDKKDLPSLHQHLLKEFPDDDNYYWTVRHQLVDKIAAFQDKSSIKFVKEKYPSLTKQPVLQYHLIGLLSDILTKDAYALLKTILIQNTPAEIDDRFLDINWFDSLELSRTLYPEILTMVQLPLLSDNILNLTATLLREEYLSPTDLVPFEATLLQIGKEKAALAKIQSAAETSFYELQSTIRLMAASKNKELNNVLNEFLEANNLSIKMQAAMLMLDKKDIGTATCLGFAGIQ